MRLISHFRQKHLFDVIVVGGGHAGCEAAAASARMGSKTLLLTHRLDTIGEMSCNPSFGGIGKGHLMREVDALDGVCSRICDISGCHYKVLNRSKGPAVWGLRAQIDRKLYKRNIQADLFDKTPNLTISAGAVEDLIVATDENVTNSNKAKIAGVILNDGSTISSKTVVITTGTFLKGEIYQGLDMKPAGRIGEDASYGLSETLDRLGFRLSRLRTGTPPRLDKKTIVFDNLSKQEPDKVATPFSFLNESVWIPYEQQIPCFITYTNLQVARIIRENIQKNLHYIAETVGPRFCPSLESKIFRFGDRDHQIWLEPEGFDSEIIYPQGISMTFSTDIQEKIIHSIKGLENTRVTRPGYGVQYDFIDPRQLKVSLETKLIDGLFLAGQINGTTGYEEAAAQGIIAGINAASLVQNRSPLLPNRTDSYIGVLIDDLTSLGTNEPYRMFTSRSEFRLQLRPDNADLRLTQKGYDQGVVRQERYEKFAKVKTRFDTALDRLKSISRQVHQWKKLYPQLYIGVSTNESKAVTALQLMDTYNISLNDLAKRFPTFFSEFIADDNLAHRLLVEARYMYFVESNKELMETIRRESSLLIPEEFDYDEQKLFLSNECREKLGLHRPQTIGAASRIPGMSTEILFQLVGKVKSFQTKSTNSSINKVGF